LILTVLLILQIKHFFCDFVLQTPYQFLNKGIYGHPGGFIHAGLHASTSMIAFFVIRPSLTLGAAIATPLMLPFLDQPLVQDYLPIFWVILFATLLRVAADAYGFALLALHRDRAIATIAVAGALASAGLNLVLTPLIGLWGAAIAFAITSGGLFAARYFFSRPRTFSISERPAKS